VAHLDQAVCTGRDRARRDRRTALDAADVDGPRLAHLEGAMPQARRRITGDPALAPGNSAAVLARLVAAGVTDGAVDPGAFAHAGVTPAHAPAPMGQWESQLFRHEMALRGGE
jgi:hypothetical protein